MKDQPTYQPKPPIPDHRTTPPNASAALAARIGTLGEVAPAFLQADWNRK